MHRAAGEPVSPADGLSARSVWRHVLVPLCALAAVGCTPRLPAAPAQKPPHDWEQALALAERLPASADECVVARPLALTPEQRALYAPIARAESWAFESDGPLVAYAQVVLSAGEREARTTLLRVSGDARTWLEAHTRLALRWDRAAANSCESGECAAAGWLAPGVVRLQRGAASELGVLPQANAPCARLLHDQPSAFEVSWRRGAESLGRDEDEPARSWSLALPSDAGLHIDRFDLFEDEAAADRDLARDGCRALWAGDAAALGIACDRTRQGRVVETRSSVSWFALELRRDDAARHARARRYAEALAQVRPDGAVRWSDPDDAQRELAARTALLEASEADVSADARALRALFERVRPAAADTSWESLRVRIERLTQMTPPRAPAITAP